MHTENYTVKSLELHLFFARIMKEHAFFLKAGFTPAGEDCAKQADFYREEFENVLCKAISLGNGIISPQVLRSGELVTEFTSLAESQTEKYTGIPINTDITGKTLRLNCGCRQANDCNERAHHVHQLNQKAIELLRGFIEFKESILKKVLCCELFTVNYPLLLEHIIREAKLYCECIEMLERDGSFNDRTLKDIECFWNQIMMEHAMFIRGLLDPNEKELICTADDFAKEYCELLERSRNAHERTMPCNSLEKTLKFREFKTAGVRGIEQCKIRSIILPLLADHVLREANHYIRLLKC